MTNPFTPTFGVTPPLLVGRDDPLIDFRATLGAAPGDPNRAILLTGIRGSGKTVLLNAFEDQARDRGWAVISETTRPGIVSELTQSVLPELLAAVSGNRTTSTIGSVNVSVAGFGAGITRQHASNDRPTPSLRSQLTELAEICDRRGTGVLLSLDEVHRQATEDLRIIAQTVQHLFREGRQLAFAAAGLPSAVSEILSDAVLTFLRRAEQFHLDAVSPSDVATALRLPIERAGRRIADDALATAAAGTEGYPFLIQLVGYHMWAAVPEPETIDLAQARVGVKRARQRIGRLVSGPALADLSERDRAFLMTMAVDPGPSHMGEIAQRLGVSRSYASQYRQRLIAAQMIVATARGYVDFATPYLREYLLANAPG